MGVVVLLLLLTLPAFALGRVAQWNQGLMVVVGCTDTPCPCSDEPGPCPPELRCVPRPSEDEKCTFSCEEIPPQEECCPAPTQYGYEQDYCSHRNNQKCKANEACCFNGCKNVCHPKY